MEEHLTKISSLLLGKIGVLHLLIIISMIWKHKTIYPVAVFWLIDGGSAYANSRVAP